MEKGQCTPYDTNHGNNSTRLLSTDQLAKLPKQQQIWCFHVPNSAPSGLQWSDLLFLQVLRCFEASPTWCREGTWKRYGKTSASALSTKTCLQLPSSPSTPPPPSPPFEPSCCRTSSPMPSKQKIELLLRAPTVLLLRSVPPLTTPGSSLAMISTPVPVPVAVTQHSLSQRRSGRRRSGRTGALTDKAASSKGRSGWSRIESRRLDLGPGNRCYPLSFFSNGFKDSNLERLLRDRPTGTS